MKNISPYTLAFGAFLCFSSIAKADDLQFVTLPQVVQTTVIRETKIPDASSVTRIVRDENGVYAVTVHRTTGEQVVYVNDSGAIVQGGGTTTTTTTTTVQKPVQTTQQVVVTPQAAQPVVETPQVVVTYDDIHKSESRYQLLEKKGKKEIYLDRQTGQKVTVKRDND
jgi:hypothetical protein